MCVCAGKAGRHFQTPDLFAHPMTRSRCAPCGHAPTPTLPPREHTCRALAQIVTLHEDNESPADNMVTSAYTHGTYSKVSRCRDLHSSSLGAGFFKGEGASKDGGLLEACRGLPVWRAVDPAAHA